MTEQAKKPYGDVEYADPGYQSDKKKRYPIDTEEHVRAAWSYINQEGNAGKYSSEDLAKIKSKIRSAMKKHGIDSEDSKSKASNETSDDAIECRAAVEISPTATNEILFLPIGLHSITPVAGGIGRPIKVNVIPSSARAIEQQRALTCSNGKRPYFDFDHQDGPASFWPAAFFWRDHEGVIAKGEWSGRGKRAVEEKDYRAFSPVFHVDNKRADAAMVVCKENADPNMGGLVNNPAFKDLPLWAKNDETLVNAGDGDNAAKKEKQMENAEIDALRSKQQELQEEVDRLKAQNKDANQSETALENIQLKIEAAELRARSALLSDQIQAKNRVEADSLIKEAIVSGAIAAKDYKTQETWRTQLIGDMTTFKPLIESLKGNTALATTRIASGNVTRVEDDPKLVYSALATAAARTSHARGREEKVKASKEFAAIYAREISPVTATNASRTLAFCPNDIDDVAIQATDVTDSDLGTLSGTLVTQRTLELLKLQFPALTAYTTDFSDQPAQFNQTIMTRTIVVPGVVSYDVSTGWADADPNTVDVPITISAHRGIPITFNSNILASTVRRLFDEFAPAQAYALAKDMVDALYVNITDANFSNNTVVATASVARSTVLAIGTALSLRGVPSGPGMRFLLLYPTVYEKLSSDTSIYTLGAFKVAPIITDRYGNNDQTREFPVTVGGIDCYEAANLPTNNGNITGFAGSKSALVIATRVPNDYTSVLPGASYGNVQMVTDPDLGITVMLAQYVNHQLGTATSRISLMYGTAAGQGSAGQLLKAASGSGSSRTS